MKDPGKIFEKNKGHASLNRSDQDVSIWANDISARFMIPFIDEMIARLGREQTARFFDRWGATLKELQDEGNWLSFRFCQEFVEEIAAQFGSTEILKVCGRRALSARYMGVLYPVFRLFASPRAMYSKLPDISKMFNKVNKIQISEVSLNRMLISYSPNKIEHKEISSYICISRKEQLAAVPALWGLPLARIEERSCQARGDESCTYEVRWQNRIPLTATLLLLLLGGVLGHFLPLGLGAWTQSFLFAALGMVLGFVFDQQRKIKEIRRFSQEQNEALLSSARTMEQRFTELQQAKAEVDLKVQERTRELRQANETLARVNEELKALDRAKSQFFANISHELRTPLTLILAPLEPLLAEDGTTLSPEQRRLLEGIRRSAMQLLKLINDLLDLSRMEEARLQLRAVPLALGPFLESIVSTASPLAVRKRIRLTLRKPCEAAVEADSEKLERVFINLLGNALKFTDPGGHVSLQMAADEKQVQVSVKDTGQGIAHKDLPQIFDRFRQGDSSTTRRHGGTGIGLALVRELVEVHGGTIDVQSTPGHGSTFTVSLPRFHGSIPSADQTLSKEEEDRLFIRDARTPTIDWTAQMTSRAEYRYQELERDTRPGQCPIAEAPAIQERQPVASQAQDADQSAKAPGHLTDSSPALRTVSETLLVVEDNLELLELLKQQLCKEFSVLTATDGQQGLALAREHSPSLVLCDLMLPFIDGATICRRLREDPRTAPIPFIMITARKDIEDSISSLDAGADDYVTKPFSMRELLARIRAQLRIRQLDLAMARADRMVLWGDTAAGLAHELRNPLNAIINGLETLGGTQEEQTRADLGRVIKDSAQRILQIVESLQTFVRNGEASFEMYDLNRGIEDTLQVLSFRLGEMRFYRDLGAGCAVQCYPAQINQVLLCLLANAADAAGPQGQIWVSSERRSDRVVVMVKDSGLGISFKDRERIFYPFFTTKPVGTGTGMGLAIARQIVERHCGTLSVTSPPGEGAELTLELPFMSESSSPNEPPSPVDEQRSSLAQIPKDPPF